MRRMLSGLSVLLALTLTVPACAQGESFDGYLQQVAAKARAGATEETRLCLSCNQECVGRMGLNRWLGRIENPRTGREALGVGTARPTDRPKAVMVVGAGPAGLQAAIAAARNGHRVTVYEKESEPGGQVRLAASVPNRAELGDMIRNQLAECRRLGVADGPRGLFQMAVILTAVTWLPLLVLDLLRASIAGEPTVSFTWSLGTHTRFLAAIPLFFAAEATFDTQSRAALEHLVDAQVIRPAERPRFDRALRDTMRWRGSILVEGALVVATIGLILGGVRTDLPVAGSSWRATGGPGYGLRISVSSPACWPGVSRSSRACRTS